MGNGQLVLEFIIQTGLVWVDPEVIKPEYDGGILVWSGNAEDQLNKFISEHITEDLQRQKRDFKALIRTQARSLGEVKAENQRLKTELKKYVEWEEEADNE